MYQVLVTIYLPRCCDPTNIIYNEIVLNIKSIPSIIFNYWNYLIKKIWCYTVKEMLQAAVTSEWMVL